MLPLTVPATLQISYFIILSFCTQMLLSDCPGLCDCKWKSGKESVICLNANLSVVPLQLDRGTQVLDLTGNTLAIVRHDEFSQAGLLNLQKIYVSRCRIKNLERYAFRHLNNLVELDLSYNLLSAVPSLIFGSIPELRELKLSGNPVQKIGDDSFANVPQLVRLELSDCRIQFIERRAFYGLEKSLEWLKLDNNRLAAVDSIAFTTLQSLHELELAGNPWNCSCNLRPLREWMLHQNVPYGVPPVCKHPPRLSSKSWDKLELDEFACVPEILAYGNKAHGEEGKNVTMTCRIAGVPEPSVRWLLKNKVIANLSGSSLSNGKKLYVVHLQNNASDLTILTADVQDAGVYVCAAENKAGRVEASVTLAVSRKPPENNLSSRVLVASVIAGTVLVAMSCLTVLCVCTARRNKLRWRRRECRREDNYEKIEMNHKMPGNANGGALQNDISVVGSVRRNGGYRVVPGADMDQDGDDEEDGNTGASTVAMKEQDGTKHFGSGLNETRSDRRWNSPEDLLDQEDLHIPRRSVKEARDDFKKDCSSTSGTYNAKYSILPTSMSSPPPSQPLGGSGTSIYTSIFSSELSSLAEEEQHKKFPDLLENSSYKFGTQLKAVKANSEGGSVTDITDLFCTLPRKRTLIHNSRYRSTDSQSPLLPESRYGSSGGDSSAGSCASSIRRLSDSQKFSASNLGGSRVSHISNSYLNLTNVRGTNLSPLTAELQPPPNSTPLLDVSSLENRVNFRPEVVLNSPPSVSSNAYDYHAAQLERFLEEYRSLQKQLTKMKESCGTSRQDKMSVDALLQHSLPVTPSTDEPCQKQSKRVLKPTSPNANTLLDNAVGFQNNELTSYLLSKSPSPNTVNSGTFRN